MIPRLGLVLVSVLAVTACGAHKPAVSGPPPSPYRGFLLKPASLAPDFRLADQSGRSVGSATERGRWYVVAFMYTHCPDVCPLIANSLGAALRRLPELRVLTVSVDPKGDTPAAVRAFIARHRLPARFRYLTGTRAQLAPVWSAFHVASIAGPKATVSHSAFELLVDPSGRERILYDAQLSASDLVHDLRLLRSSSA